jgi:hypothetical protein
MAIRAVMTVSANSSRTSSPVWGGTFAWVVADDAAPRSFMVVWEKWIYEPASDVSIKAAKPG